MALCVVSYRPVIIISELIMMLDAQAILRIDITCSEVKNEIKELEHALASFPVLGRQWRLRRYAQRDTMGRYGFWSGWPYRLWGCGRITMVMMCPVDIITTRVAIVAWLATSLNPLTCSVQGIDCEPLCHCFPAVSSNMSIRGKNVCVFFLLGNCKFGAAKCNYSHSISCAPICGVD